MMLKFPIFVLLLLVASLSDANTAINGDFETADFSGWTTFTTATGTLGPAGAVITPFDVSGSGATLAARFQVADTIQPSTNQGGGIFQSVNVAAGAFSVSADIAAWDSTSSSSNSDWGLFELLVNGNVVDSHGFGQPLCCDVVRSTLSFADNVAAGALEIRFRMSRPFLDGSLEGSTPFQYLDNIVVNASAVPLPPAVLLLLSPLALLLPRRCRTQTA